MIVYKVNLKYVDAYQLGEPESFEIVNSINELSEYASEEIIKHGIHKSDLYTHCYIDITSNRYKKYTLYWKHIRNLTIEYHRDQTINELLL